MTSSQRSGRPSPRIIEFGALLLILASAAFFRWTGLAWDSGYLFHPDERQIVLVISNLNLPADPLQVFTPDSPLNPKFFAYGSFPIYLLRLAAPFAPATGIVGPWADDRVAQWVILGRAISGLFDLGTIVLTWALGRRMYGARVGLFAAACTAFTVLHIQLSHFYAVDTILTFFTLATLYAALRVAERFEVPESLSGKGNAERKWVIVCGVSFGLALATKVSALPLVFPILYACYAAAGAPQLKISRARVVEIWRALRRPFLQILAVALLTFVVTQPYVLIDWYAFGRDVIRETFVARGWLDYPYTRQFIGTIPFVYQVTQGAIWGMGVPLGIFAWGGMLLFAYHWWKSRTWRDAFLLSFALIYFVAIGLQYAKYLRYLLPLLPVLYIMATCAFVRLLAGRNLVQLALGSMLLVFAFIYSLAFVQIYSREHPWLTASRWIYANVPRASTLVVEEWDDALPTMIRSNGGEQHPDEYTQLQLGMYDDDTDAKRATLAAALSEADAVVLASQRLYRSIGRLPSRYPMTNRYYAKLFNGELGFEPVMTARNAPGWSPLTIRDAPFQGLAFDETAVNALLDSQDGWNWNWGFADESFSVYDHPQPIVFRKVRALSAEEIAARLGE